MRGQCWLLLAFLLPLCTPSIKTLSTSKFPFMQAASVMSPQIATYTAAVIRIAQQQCSTTGITTPNVPATATPFLFVPLTTTNPCTNTISIKAFA